MEASLFDRKLGSDWLLACEHSDVNATQDQFLEVANLLLEQVQLNSTHLFRADILFDSSRVLATVAEKEARYKASPGKDQTAARGWAPAEKAQSTRDAPVFTDFGHQRTVVRRLIPRKPQLDAPLEQSCFTYGGKRSDDKAISEALVVYVPHCEDPNSMPWYHPNVRGLAYRFTCAASSSAALSIHYRPFPDTPVQLPDRLGRTFQSLLRTIVRLLRLPSKSGTDQAVSSTKNRLATGRVTMNDITATPLIASTLKDTILPQHTVQNTYTRLKQVYAADLIARWVEKTEPSKHVFEDLSIAAFLIELWKSMYGSPESFHGFVDIACGNGVLVYVLIKEGWHGYGFDARRRKTWDVLRIDEHLKEQICVPRPFLQNMSQLELASVDVHDGVFPLGTFIISNHADELTCWTPLLAAISNPDAPLPFLTIPCCSHALDGSRKRYHLKDITVSPTASNSLSSKEDEKEAQGYYQPASGDLKAMHAAKQKANNHTDEKSMYACLTRKTAALALELGMETELTLMRIPSTRNIGVVGNRISKGPRHSSGLAEDMGELDLENGGRDARIKKIEALIERECVPTGGIETSARTWIEKAKKLQGGQARGKVNLQMQREEHG